MSESKINDGGPAFPTPSGHARVKGYQPGYGEYEQTVEVCKTGMSLRAYYKARAMQSLMRDPDWLKEARSPRSLQAIIELAETAGIIANAMIAEDEAFAKGGA